ncbi:MAG: alpha-amylase/4-alpha-glucanotransferase domain-containing protein [Chitinivibrionales bacterium]
MKRHAIALFVHPFKDRLLPKSALIERLNDFCRALIDLGNSFQNIRFNLVIPGYFLELMDPLLLLQLRELHKRGLIEWLYTGYTEPFLSYSPPWLLSENLKYGMNTFTEFTGTKPCGFVPGFSNWEPSVIDILRDAGVLYCVVSRALLPPKYRQYYGYWITEHMGSSIAFFPAHVVRPSEAEKMLNGLDGFFSEDRQNASAAKLMCVEFLYPLSDSGDAAPKALQTAIHTLDRMLLSYQSVRCTEFFSTNFNLGLHYLPSSIVLERNDAEARPYFLNEFHIYDQAGIIQRKMMDIAENIAARKETKYYEPMKKTLFFVQDVNRFVPSLSSGFMLFNDRKWCFEKMIGIEQALDEKDEIKGGQIRIIDFLRNGNKTIIMSNKNLALSIDYKNGGQVFEMDFKSRNSNVCSALGPSGHLLPMIIEPPQSRTAFIDHCMPIEAGINEFLCNPFPELGDFFSGDFTYKVKKTLTGIKAALNRNGSLMQGEKNCPLNMEKVFGLEKDYPVISFVYQFSNHSLTSYAFKFALEMTFSLPGIGSEKARISQGKNVYGDFDKRPFSMLGITEWTLDDLHGGIRLSFSLQKPVDVWCFPVAPPTGSRDGSHAVTMVINTPVTIEGSKAWSLMGNIVLKKLRAQKKNDDEI